MSRVSTFETSEAQALTSMVNSTYGGDISGLLDDVVTGATVTLPDDVETDDLIAFLIESFGTSWLDPNNPALADEFADPAVQSMLTEYSSLNSSSTSTETDDLTDLLDTLGLDTDMFSSSQDLIDRYASVSTSSSTDIMDSSMMAALMQVNPVLFFMFYIIQVVGPTMGKSSEVISEKLEENNQVRIDKMDEISSLDASDPEDAAQISVLNNELTELNRGLDYITQTGKSVYEHFESIYQMVSDMQRMSGQVQQFIIQS